MNSAKFVSRYHVIGETTGTPSAMEQINQSRSSPRLSVKERARIERARAKYEKQWHTLARKFPADPNQAYCVIVYSFSKEIGEDGLRGLWYVQGTYSKPKAAIKAAKKITRETGLTANVVTTAEVVTMKPQLEQSKVITLSKEERDDQMTRQEEEDCEAEIDQYEKQMAIKEILEKDLRQSQKPDSLERYRQNWYDRITLEMEIGQMKRLLDQKKKKAKELDLVIRKGYVDHPEYDVQIPDAFKKILTSLGEEHYIEMLTEGHAALRYDVLGIKWE